MSGDVYSSMEGKESLISVTNRGRVNLNITIEKWCGRKGGPCEVSMDVCGYELCSFCKYKRRLDIPKMIEKEKKRKNG